MPVPTPRRRRMAVGGGGLLAVVGVFAALNAAGSNPLPGSVPVIGRNATSVFKQIQSDGLPITDGEPADPKFREMTRHNACKSSRSFVRSDADQGWGVVCVRPPQDVYRQISRAFETVPALLGPLWVDDHEGDVIVFGFGWPANASKMIFDAIGASGTYISDQ